MPSIGQGQTSNAANPILHDFVLAAGDPNAAPSAYILIEPFSLEFQIFALTSGSPVQVYPTTAGTRQAVNLTTHKLGTGHYVAEWAVPSSESVGLHQIVWFMRATSTATERTWARDFEVLPDLRRALGQSYALVADLRGEGFTAAQVTDLRAHMLLVQASRYIEKMTGRFFEPRAMDIDVDGRGGRSCMLGVPVIAVEDVTLDASPFGPSGMQYDFTYYRVYNRHLRSGGMVDPDDRENPKIEFFHTDEVLAGSGTYGFSRLIFPRGQQNVHIRGVFGYTDYDGSPAGGTPDLIRHVTKLIAVRELAPMGKLDKRDEAHKRYRIIQEQTRDQSYQLQELTLKGAFTGDPEIDTIISSFVRPMSMGAA